MADKTTIDRKTFNRLRDAVNAAAAKIGTQAEENKALQARVEALEAALREIRDCTEKHGGAATALKIIRATLEGSGND